MLLETVVRIKPERRVYSFSLFDVVIRAMTQRRKGGINTGGGDRPPAPDEASPTFNFYIRHFTLELPKCKM